jgi:hypothetical protein
MDIGSATTRATSSRRSGVTFNTTHDAGIPAAETSLTKAAHFDDAGIWAHAVREGTHSARLGERSMRGAACALIVPSTANNCARPCQCGWM